MRVVAIYKLDCTSKVRLPLYNCPISAGSPSFGDDCVDEYINLRDLVEHPDRCFLLRVFGDSMIGANIHSGSLLVVDRMVEPMNGDVAIAAVNGDLTVKQLKWQGDRLMLVAANPSYQPLYINAGDDFHIWGVVTQVVHNLPRGTTPLGSFLVTT